jgi:hypothetical protein
MAMTKILLICPRRSRARDAQEARSLDGDTARRNARVTEQSAGM